MKHMVRDTFYSIGDRSGDFAKTIGSTTADLARRFGDGTVDLARRVGPRRALIGVAVAAIAIGGTIMLVRFLRARRAEGGISRDEASASGIGSRANDRIRSPSVESGLSY